MLPLARSESYQPIQIFIFNVIEFGSMPAFIKRRLIQRYITLLIQFLDGLPLQYTVHTRLGGWGLRPTGIPISKQHKSINNKRGPDILIANLHVRKPARYQLRLSYAGFLSINILYKSRLGNSGKE